MGFAEEPGRIKWPSWFAKCVVFTNHCLPHIISLILKQTVAMLQGHQDGKRLVTRGNFL